MSISDRKMSFVFVIVAFVLLFDFTIHLWDVKKKKRKKNALALVVSVTVLDR